MNGYFRRHRLPLFFLLLCFLVGLTGCLTIRDGKLVFGNTDGRVTLTTTPAGANIHVDGVKTKWSTPSTLKFTRGEHDIQFTMAGFDPSPLIVVEVPQNETVVLDDYKMASEYGTISLSTTPPGAYVYVDGALSKWNTPATFEMSAGKHEIWYRMPGHDDSPLFEARVPSGSTLTLDDFKMTSLFGSISLDTTPRESDIYIDGVLSAWKTPVSVTLPVGQHVIAFKHEDYKDSPNLPMFIQPGVAMVFSYALKSLYGTLAVTTSPSGAEVHVDGDPTGYTTPANLELPAGKHEVQLVRAGSTSPTMKVTVPSADKATVAYSFGNGHGVGSFATGELGGQPGAEVYIDGVKSAFVTPCAVNLPVGSHTVEFHKYGYTPSTPKPFEILTNVVETVTANLSILPTISFTVGVGEPTQGIVQLTPVFSITDAEAATVFKTVTYYYVATANTGPVAYATVTAPPFLTTVDTPKMPDNTAFYAVADDGCGNSIQSPVVVVPVA